MMDRTAPDRPQCLGQVNPQIQVFEHPNAASAMVVGQQPKDRHCEKKSKGAEYMGADRH